MNEESMVRLAHAVKQVLDINHHASFQSGVCCCGSEMSRHDNPVHCGHSPVDSGEYYGDMALQELQDASECLKEWL